MNFIILFFNNSNTQPIYDLRRGIILEQNVEIKY